MNEQKNLILAVVLAVLILLSFHYFYERPRNEMLLHQAEVAHQTKKPDALVKSLELQKADLNLVLDREDALKASPRIAIKTPRLHGSVNLRGAVIDDIELSTYRESPNRNSPDIVLLTPESTHAPHYAAFGWTSKDGQLKLPDQHTLWHASGETLTQNTPVTLTWENGQGLRFERIIAVDENYMFSILDRVINTTSMPQSLSSFAQVNRFETPKTGGFFILHEGPVGVLNGKLTEISYSTLKEGAVVEQNTTGGWLGITDKYWLVAVVPDQKTPVKAIFRGHTTNSQDRYQTDVMGFSLEAKPGQTIEATHHLYAGAKELHLLDMYQAKLGVEKFDLAVDFGWFYFLTKPLFYVLDYLHHVLGNFGLAILALTVLFKLAFFPLANKSYRSMSHMKKVQPQIETLKQRFGDDKVRMNQELMQLYKREKVNPLAGCLPMLIQAPVFFCLYKVLFVTIEMRQAPFYGWINDLSAPDPTTIFNLFGLIPWTPPSFLMLGAWPILMGLTMYLQQRLNPQPADPAQAKAFMIMPVFLTFLLSSFPAGLVIYWAWNNILSMAQQWTIMRLEEKRS